MTRIYDYDLIVIGGGAGGFVASKFANGLGKKVAIIEKNKLGGECTLSGCVPSKALIKSGIIAHQARNLRNYGLSTTTDIVINPDNVMGHVRSVIKKVYDGHQPSMFKKLGIDVLFGNPHFMDNHTIELEGRGLSAKAFIISTGSSAFIPPIEGMDKVPYLTNNTFFEIGRLPSSMIVLGGGPIGIELAAAVNRLGVKVHVIEIRESILFREDRELVNILSEKLKEEGLDLHTETKALKLSLEMGLVAVMVEDKEGQKKEIKADALLVAVGRKANVEDLNLNNAGVKYSPKGIIIDNSLRTTAPNIYACGDVAGPYQFSHMAEYGARIAVRNAFLPIKKKADYKDVAWCTFTDPELAHAGSTEEEARKLTGDNIKVYRYEYKNIDKAKTDIAEIGMSKFIVDRKGKIIGAHILGSRAGEIIHEAQLAKSFGIPFYKLNSVIHIYPTFSDIVKQPAKLFHIDKLQNNPVLKFIRDILKIW